MQSVPPGQGTWSSFQQHELSARVKGPPSQPPPPTRFSQAEEQQYAPLEYAHGWLSGQVTAGGGSPEEAEGQRLEIINDYHSENFEVEEMGKAP